jgi:predicted cupin superfamily sugar epimerase
MLRHARSFVDHVKIPSSNSDECEVTKMSSVPGVQETLDAAYAPNGISQESKATKSIIDALKLEKHIEGGYFAELDRNPLIVPNPFLQQNSTEANTQTAEKPFSGDDSVRNASTTIYYMLSPTTPQGHFHRNKGRTVHTLIEGRGRYVLIHADEEGAKKRIESFVVGKDVGKGERSVWIVEGGKYKASYLLPLEEGKKDEDDRLLISEVGYHGRTECLHNTRLTKCRPSFLVLSTRITIS